MAPRVDALAHAVEHVEIELNAAADSPRVDIETSSIASTGNFHIPGLAIAHEALGLGIAQIAALIVERCMKLLGPETSGLPLQLTRHGPQQSGFATTQKTLTAIANDIRHLANPACLDFLPVSAGIEDHAPMAMRCVTKVGEMRERLAYLAAIEAMIAAQAVDLRDPVCAQRSAKARVAPIRRFAIACRFSTTTGRSAPTSKRSPRGCG